MEIESLKIYKKEVENLKEILQNKVIKKYPKYLNIFSEHLRLIKKDVERAEVDEKRREHYLYYASIKISELKKAFANLFIFDRLKNEKKYIAFVFELSNIIRLKNPPLVIPHGVYTYEEIELVKMKYKLHTIYVDTFEDISFWTLSAHEIFHAKMREEEQNFVYELIKYIGIKNSDEDYFRDILADICCDMFSLFLFGNAYFYPFYLKFRPYMFMDEKPITFRILLMYEFLRKTENIDKININKNIIKGYKLYKYFDEILEFFEWNKITFGENSEIIRIYKEFWKNRDENSYKKLKEILDEISVNFDPLSHFRSQGMCKL